MYCKLSVTVQYHVQYNTVCCARMDLLLASRSDLPRLACLNMAATNYKGERALSGIFEEAGGLCPQLFTLACLELR